MRMSAVVIPCLISPALLCAEQTELSLDESEHGFRSAWRQTFVDACSANALQQEAESWCGCVADQVLQQLEFGELLEGSGLDRALEPATVVCDEQGKAHEVTL